MKRMKKFLAVLLAAVMVMSLGSVSVFANGTYTVTIDSVTNGTVTTDVDFANEGDTVTLTLTPASGYYEFDTLTVTGDSTTNTVQTSGSGTTYTFIMPDENVTVTATFKASSTYTLTIENDVSGYTYMYYQIFTGDLATDGETLANIAWGNGITDEGIAALKEYYNLAATATAEDVAKEIVAANNAQALATKLASESNTYLKNGQTMTDDATNSGTYYASNLASGYYLVLNTSVPNGTDTSYSNYIVQVVSNVTIEPKSDVATLDKTVSDVNDSDSSTAQGDTDSADYDIGDTIEYTLTATLPSNYADYSTYKLVFNDTMSSGLTFNSSSVEVTVDGTALAAANYTVTPTTDTAGATITITIDDLKTVAANATSSSTIVVKYTATLNNNAEYKNTNSASLTYSNNPNQSSDTGTTTTDLTTVYTYTLTINKVDQSNDPLSGAGFTLYKYDGSDYVAVGSEITGVATFNWSGLDDGQYKLVETTTPSGYNTMEDVVFYIIATHTESGVTELGIYSDASGNSPLTGYTSNASSGAISASITNYSGTIIPTTGGMGTTILYIVGAILVIGAAVILITRRRMANR